MAQMPVDCCLSVKNQTIDKIVVADYYPQAKGCALDATMWVCQTAVRALLFLSGSQLNWSAVLAAWWPEGKKHSACLMMSSGSKTWRNTWIVWRDAARKTAIRYPSAACSSSHSNTLIWSTNRWSLFLVDGSFLYDDPQSGCSCQAFPLLETPTVEFGLM